MIRILCVAALALGLAACAGAVPGNPQSYAGINEARAEFGEDGKPRVIRFIGGKESDRVALDVKLPNGTVVHYVASGLRAFDGQVARQAVETAVSADVRAVAPGIVDAIMKALMARFGPPVP